MSSLSRALALLVLMLHPRCRMCRPPLQTLVVYVSCLMLGLHQRQPLLAVSLRSALRPHIASLKPQQLVLLITEAGLRDQTTRPEPEIVDALVEALQVGVGRGYCST